jgi:hypothetical protein
MDPPADGAHVVGAPLRPPPGRPPLRAHHVFTTNVKPLITRSSAECLATLAYHPHIQHTDLGTTSVYLQGIDPSEIIDAVRSRRPPTISATAGLQLRR